MIKTCQNNWCKKQFEITNEDLEFYEKVSPVFSEKKYLIPSPTLCPDCRQQRRLAFRNERNFYNDKCDLCNSSVISLYSPNKKNPVYCQKCWWSEKRNDSLRNEDFDFNRSFFEQFNELVKTIPRISILNMYSENSDYTNFCWKNKNCYLLVSSGDNEDCFYGISLWNYCKNCVDCHFISKCEICYQCLYSTSCYNCFFLYDCQNCMDCFVCKDCHNCKNCILCQGLRNREYCIKNKQYTKEEYEKIKKELIPKIYFKQNLRQIIEQLLDLKEPNIARKEVQCENCLGDYLYNCKNCFDCYHCRNLEDCRFMTMAHDAKDSYDCEFCDTKAQIFYDGISLAGYNLLFCSFVWDCDNMIYCDLCFNCKNCFGCIGLQKKEYCILNKQYSKEEYEELVPKIIEHMSKTNTIDLKGFSKPFRSPIEWGEFFPPNLSPFGYNETVANEYYPLNPSIFSEPSAKQDVETCHGMSLQDYDKFNWSDYEPPKLEVKKTIPANKLPDNIDKIPDDILNWAILCEVTKKPFKIIKQELKFYREHNLPIPRRHPDQRHKDRLALRNPRKLFERKCDKCNKEIQTTYSPKRPEIVYCEDCYLKEVY